MPPLRIAVIGAGRIGRRHLEVLLADPAYAVAGIADPDPAADAHARAIGIRYDRECERLLDATRPDGAVVATPNQLHVSTAMACVERKVPALIEKPITDSLAAGLALVEAAERAGVPLLVGHHRRHNPIMRKAAKLIAGGAVGKVVAVTGLWLARKPDDYFDLAWRRAPGGGPVLINAIHDVDCLRMLCGEIDGVQAYAAHGARGFAVEDTAAAALRFASGALGTLLVSDAAAAPWTWEWTSHENPFYPHEPRDCYLIAGSKGSLGVPSLELGWHEPGKHWGDALTRRRVAVAPADAFVAQLRNFARVIRGEEAALVDGRQGLLTLATTLAITQSAKDGRPVRIDDILKHARDDNRRIPASRHD